MEMKSGYSPAFLVYNTGTTFPSILNMSPAQLENVLEEMPRSLGDEIKAREEALKNHLEIKMSNKLRQAILAKTRPTPDEKNVGEVVHFKRAKDDRWRGPGVVADSIRGQASVKMGKYYYPCRHADLLRVTETELIKFKKDNKIDNHALVVAEDQISQNEELPADIETEYLQLISGNNSIPAPRYPVVSPPARDCSSLTRVQANGSPSVAEVTASVSSTVAEVPANVSSPVAEVPASCSTTSAPVCDSGPVDAVPIQADGNEEIRHNNTVINQTQQRKIVKPKKPSNRVNYQVNLEKGDKIQFKLDEGGDRWVDSQVIGRCQKGKRKGEWFTCEINKRKKVYNLSPGTFIWRKVDDSEDQVNEMEFDVNHAASDEKTVTNECFLQEEEVHEVFAVKVPHNQHHMPHVVKAKNKEHSTLKEFNTYSEIIEDSLTPEQKENIIGALWVIVAKELLGETVCKARICCRGDMETIEIKTDSPTIAKPSERILLSVAACKGWKLQSLDFKAAFLQGKPLEREVIVVPPRDLLKYENGKRILWRLNKSMYGLVDAARNFNKKLDKDLLAVGCTRCTFDKAMYFYFKDSELIGLLAIHVDNICFAGNAGFYM